MFEGYVDRVRGNIIEGWIWNSQYPDSSVLIALLNHNGLIISIALADEFRSDLADSEKGNGAHGFTIDFPEGTNVQGMRVLAYEYGYELKGSPLFLSTDGAIIDQDDRRLDVFERFGEANLRIRMLSTYVDQQEKDISNRFSLLQLRIEKLKASFGVLRAAASLSPHITKFVDVIFFPPIDWSYRVQRPQRLAAGLAALGYRVWYVSPQMLPCIGEASHIIYDEPTPNVFLIKVRCCYPHTEINREPLSTLVIDSVERAFSELFEKQTIEDPCYVIGSAGWEPLIDSLPRGFTIYDLMDWHAGFSATTASLLQAERKLACNADMVVCSSAALQNYSANEFKHKNTLLLRNATHTQMFALSAPSGRPVVGYIGAIEHWFDRDLLVEVAEAIPEVQFILVGHVAPMHEALRNVPNIICVGECGPDQVAEYVCQFHVGIIPFLDNDLIRHTDPVKAYEYLAAGRHVVATNLPELQRFNKGVTIATTPSEFADGIRSALKNAGDAKAISARKRLVMNDTWDARAAMLKAAILANL